MTAPLVSVIIPVGPDHRDMAQTAGDSAVAAGAGAVRIGFDNLDDSLVQMGVCGTRNGLIHSAPYKLIVPLDADDTLLPDGLQKLVQAWEPGTLVYGGWIENDEYVSPAPPEMLRRKHVAYATWLFHKDDWRRVGGYDPDFNIGGEDWAFMLALVNAGVKLVRIDEPIYRRTVNAGSRTDQARNRIGFIRQLLREKYPLVMR